MKASPVEDRDLIIEPDDHQVDFTDECILRLAIGQGGEVGDFGLLASG